MARNFLEFDYKYNTVIDVFYNSVMKFGERPFLRSWKNDSWKDLSWNETASQVEALASWLINTGLKPGGMIAIFSGNRPEWVIADLAALSIACTDISIYPETHSSDAAHIIAESRAAVCFCKDKAAAESILLRRRELPNLKKIVVFEESSLKDDIVIQFTDAVKEGASRLRREDIREFKKSVKCGDLMTVIYSSGTAGQPKGVMLSHSAVMFTLIKYNMRQNLPEGHTVLSLLPLAAAKERIMGYYSTMMDGGIIAFSRGLARLADDMKEIKPDFAVYHPAAVEKIYSLITGKIRKAATWKQRLFERALSIGKEGVSYSTEGKPLPMSLRFKYFLYYKLVFTRLITSTGLNRIGFIVAGAPLRIEIHDFFWGMNIHARKCYGLTETSAILNVDGDPAVFSVKSGGSISPFPETEMKITVDGEILVKGPQLMKGYLNRPQETQDMFTHDGWFRTGDLGSMDVHGYLTVSDRKKDIIITSTGKKIPPALVEAAFSSHPLIKQAAVFGDSKKFIAALIVPDFENLMVWAAGKGIKSASERELLTENRIITVYEKISEMINHMPGQQEPVKKIKLIPREFSYEEGEITPTLKLRRKNISASFKKELETLFAE